MIANLVAATAIGARATIMSDVLLSALLAGVAIEVAAFGISQAISLHRQRSDAAR